MWSARSRVAQACLTGRHLWWSDGKGPLDVTGHSDPDQGWNSLETALRTSATKRLKLWFGGSLCRVTLVEPVQGARNRMEAEAAALAALVAAKKAEAADRAFYASRYGGAEPAPIAIVPGSVHSRLARLQSHGIEVEGCRPWWSAIAVDRKAGDGAIAPGGSRELMAFYDGEAASVFGSRPDGLVDQASTMIPVLAVDEAKRLARRAAVARSLESASLVHLSDAVQDGTAAALAEDFAFTNCLAVHEAI